MFHCFLHPRGLTVNFGYPPESDVLVISTDSILTAVYTTTVTGRRYIISDDETAAASQALDLWKASHFTKP